MMTIDQSEQRMSSASIITGLGTAVHRLSFLSLVGLSKAGVLLVDKDLVEHEIICIQVKNI